MIGVVADPEEHAAAREFFELFKTPWEFHHRGRRYDVLLSTSGERPDEGTADFVVVYCGGKTPDDEEASVEATTAGVTSILAFGATRVPIYGRCVTFQGGLEGLSREGHPRETAARVVRTGRRLTVRVGYDLFREVGLLLAKGQPLEHAGIPTLDLHIALLREILGWSGVPLVEIPPAPDGYSLIACLTHDVDHPLVRRHWADHTAAGFLYRACLGSVINVLRGRASMRDLLTNWAAVLRLPFVHCGLAKDFWLALDRYRAIEAAAGSTFFVIPVEGYPGETGDGPAPRRRAARYRASDIAPELRRLAAAGSEIGVHGIDAWLDSAKGLEELREIVRITGTPEIGIRMHWLYGDQRSPAILEDAGFSYDSTSGYNEAIGYRAGTTQAFAPPGTTWLLELPLHIMDTALFYPCHLNLSPREARQRVRTVIEHARRLGGAVTVNWHDRSIAPERLWGRVYREIVRDLEDAGAWFPTASRGVSWFRKRRAAVFESVTCESGQVHAKVSIPTGDTLPGLTLRVHEPRECAGNGRIDAARSNGYVDIAMNRKPGHRCVHVRRA